MRNSVMVAAVAMISACGGQPNFELYIAQTPMAVLPEGGQAIYSIPGRNINVVSGWVVNSEIANFNGKSDVHNVFRLEVDSQEKFYVGQKLTWANGQGTILRVTRLAASGVAIKTTDESATGSKYAKPMPSAKPVTFKAVSCINTGFGRLTVNGPLDCNSATYLVEYAVARFENDRHEAAPDLQGVIVNLNWIRATNQWTAAINFDSRHPMTSEQKESASIVVSYLLASL